MNKSVLFVATLALAAGSVSARGEGDHKKGHFMSAESIDARIEKRVERMDKTLDLTDEQRKEVDELMKAHADRMKERAEAFRKEMDALEKDIRAVLTDDQKKKYEALSESKGDRKGKDGRKKKKRSAD